MPHTFPTTPDGALTAPHDTDTIEAARRWQAHVDAGRIGRPRRPARPEIAANRARTEAIFRAPGRPTTRTQEGR